MEKIKYLGPSGLPKLRDWVKGKVDAAKASVETDSLSITEIDELLDF